MRHCMHRAIIFRHDVDSLLTSLRTLGTVAPTNWMSLPFYGPPSRKPLEKDGPKISIVIWQARCLRRRNDDTVLSPQYRPSAFSRKRSMQRSVMVFYSSLCQSRCAPPNANAVTSTKHASGTRRCAFPSLREQSHYLASVT